MTSPATRSCRSQDDSYRRRVLNPGNQRVQPVGLAGAAGPPTGSRSVGGESDSAMATPAIGRHLNGACMMDHAAVPFPLLTGPRHPGDATAPHRPRSPTPRSREATGGNREDPCGLRHRRDYSDNGGTRSPANVASRLPPARSPAPEARVDPHAHHGPIAGHSSAFFGGVAAGSSSRPRGKGDAADRRRAPRRRTPGRLGAEYGCYDPGRGDWRSPPIAIPLPEGPVEGPRDRRRRS